MTEGRKLSSYIEHPVTEADLRRQWSEIENRIEKPAPRFGHSFLVPAIVGLSLAAIMVVVAVTMLRRPTLASAWDGAVFDSSADEVSVALADGSRIDLEPVSRVIVREGSALSVRLDVHKGGARFNVPHVAGRSFDVLAGGVKIRVIGTRFTVAVAGAPSGKRVTVSVQEGVIEAESAGEKTRVRAGETWSTVQAEPTPTPPAALPAPPEPRESATPPSESPEQVVEQPAPVVVTSRPATGPPSAQELFEKGNLARQSGDAAGAASAYADLLRHHPSDARAGLAAFELGRLKMDQLGDMRGAVVNLQRAANASGSAFREDALARLVRAHDTMGDTVRCEQAKNSYLTSYPSGVHAGAVRKACQRAR
jgi:transmembrane sensor